MSKHTSSDTRYSGIDKDALNLPSFRDLVSFRGAVPRSNTTDASFSRHGHGEANVVPSLPRRHAEEPFEVDGVQRAGYYHDDRHATQHLPHRGRQQIRFERALQEQRTSPLTRNQHGEVLPSYRSRGGEHCYARDFDARSVQPRTERVCEGYKRLPQDRVEPHAFSISDPPRSEVAPTSHEMVRTTERYPPIAPHPFDGRSLRIEASKVPDMLRFVERDRRRTQVSVVTTPAPRPQMRWPPHIQDDCRHRSLGRQVSERQQQEKPISARQQTQTPGKHHHHVHSLTTPPNSSFDHLRRDVGPQPELSLTNSEGAKFNPSRRHEESSPIPSPHDRARMFDYSCARLPNEIRKQSSSTSMRPPTSSARQLNTPTNHSHSGNRHQKADDVRQGMHSTSSSAYVEEQRKYTALHSLYRSDVRNKSAGQSEQERNIMDDYERNRHARENSEVSDRTVAGPTGRFDQSLIHDHRAVPRVDLRRDYDGRTSSGSLERHAARPVVVMPEGRSRPAVAALSSCESYRPSHGQPEPSLHFDQRHGSIDPAGRSSDGGQHRNNHNLLDREAELCNVYAPHTPKYRGMQPSRRVQDDHPRSQSAGERVHSLQGKVPPALPLPRNATPVASVLHRRCSPPTGSHASSPAQYEKSSRVPGYIPPEGSKTSSSPREQWHIQMSYGQQDHPICGSVDPTLFARQAPKEGQRFLNRDNTEDYTKRRTAEPERHHISSPAVLHESDLSPFHHLQPATPVHRTKQVLQRSSSGGVPPTSRSPPYSLRSSGDGARHERQTQLPEVTNNPTNCHPLQPLHQPAPRLSLLEDPPIVHRSRALPPVIASQHTSLHHAHPSSNGHQRPSAAAMPAPPTRPMKRHRADSDTSLLVKASRFTVVDDPRQADVSDPTLALRSPPKHLCAPEKDSGSRHQRYLNDSDETRDAQRFSGESDAKSKSVNGSAPITPPLSST